MIKKIKVVGIKTKRIIVKDKPKRRVDPNFVAKSLGAELGCKRKF